MICTHCGRDVQDCHHPLGDITPELLEWAPEGWFDEVRPGSKPIASAMEERQDCSSCGEECAPEGECPKSRRECGHHCNHSWSHDVCCWCGVRFYDHDDDVEVAP